MKEFKMKMGTLIAGTSTISPSENLYRNLSHVYYTEYRDGMTPTNMKTIAEVYLLKHIPTSEASDFIETIIQDFLNGLSWNEVLNLCIHDIKFFEDIAFEKHDLIY